MRALPCMIMWALREGRENHSRRTVFKHASIFYCTLAYYCNKGTRKAHEHRHSTPTCHANKLHCNVRLDTGAQLSHLMHSSVGSTNIYATLINLWACIRKVDLMLKYKLCKWICRKRLEYQKYVQLSHLASTFLHYALATRTFVTTSFILPCVAAPLFPLKGAGVMRDNLLSKNRMGML